MRPNVDPFTRVQAAIKDAVAQPPVADHTMVLARVAVQAVFEVVVRAQDATSIIPKVLALYGRERGNGDAPLLGTFVRVMDATILETLTVDHGEGIGIADMHADAYSAPRPQETT